MIGTLVDIETFLRGEVCLRPMMKAGDNIAALTSAEVMKTSAERIDVRIVLEGGFFG